MQVQWCTETYRLQIFTEIIPVSSQHRIKTSSVVLGVVQAIAYHCIFVTLSTKLKQDTDLNCFIGSKGCLVALHSPLTALLWTDVSIDLVVSFSLKFKIFFPPSEEESVFNQTSLANINVIE